MYEKLTRNLPHVYNILCMSTPIIKLNMAQKYGNVFKTNKFPG